MLFRSVVGDDHDLATADGGDSGFDGGESGGHEGLESAAQGFALIIGCSGRQPAGRVPGDPWIRGLS